MAQLRHQIFPSFLLKVEDSLPQFEHIGSCAEFLCKIVLIPLANSKQVLKNPFIRCPVHTGWFGPRIENASVIRTQASLENFCGSQTTGRSGAPAVVTFPAEL